MKKTKSLACILKNLKDEVNKWLKDNNMVCSLNPEPNINILLSRYSTSVNTITDDIFIDNKDVSQCLSYDYFCKVSEFYEKIDDYGLLILLKESLEFNFSEEIKIDFLDKYLKKHSIRKDKVEKFVKESLGDHVKSSLKEFLVPYKERLLDSDEKVKRIENVLENDFRMKKKEIITDSNFKKE